MSTILLKFNFDTGDPSLVCYCCSMLDKFSFLTFKKYQLFCVSRIFDAVSPAMKLSFFVTCENQDNKLLVDYFAQGNTFSQIITSLSEPRLLPATLHKLQHPERAIQIKPNDPQIHFNNTKKNCFTNLYYQGKVASQ